MLTIHASAWYQDFVLRSPTRFYISVALFCVGRVEDQAELVQGGHAEPRAKRQGKFVRKTLKTYELYQIYSHVSKEK